MSVESLVAQLVGLLPTGCTSRTYDEIEIMFPPGIKDDGVKRELAELASECGCEIRNQPAYTNVVFIKGA